MTYPFRRDEWKELDDLMELNDSRVLPVGGFIFGDSFETFLRKISEDYLWAAWLRLSTVLDQNQIAVNDLSWGWMHPGVTRFADVGEEIRANEAPSNYNGDAPGDYIGWTSCHLSEIWRTEQLNHLDAILKDGEPSLRCTVTYRSVKWRIKPDNFRLALKLVEALCTEDSSIVDWNPDVILEWYDGSELWRMAAEAIRDDNQQYLDRIVKEAKEAYTPLGFRIFIHGYMIYLQGAGGTLRLPSIA